MHNQSMSSLTLFTDGGSRGNPGPSAHAFVVTNPAGIILVKCGNYLGITTNNQAEYAGLLAGLTWVLEHHPETELVIKMDSLLIVNQIKGQYKVKHPDMIPLHRQVMAQLAHLTRYSIIHVPRAENSLADELVNQTLDAHQTR